MKLYLITEDCHCDVQLHTQEVDPDAAASGNPWRLSPEAALVVYREATGQLMVLAALQHEKAMLVAQRAAELRIVDGALALR